MASKINRKSVNGINIASPFSKSPEGAFVLNRTTLAAVADDLKNLIVTNYGERVVQYDFGANLRPILFDQGPFVAQRIKDSIEIAVQKWMPYVKINSIEVDLPNSENSTGPNTAHVSINFSIAETGLQGQTEITVRS